MIDPTMNPTSFGWDNYIQNLYRDQILDAKEKEDDELVNNLIFDIEQRFPNFKENYGPF